MGDGTGTGGTRGLRAGERRERLLDLFRKIEEEERKNGGCGGRGWGEEQKGEVSRNFYVSKLFHI